MAISKTKREAVYLKYGGLCAYTGTPLKEDWQVDHKVPQYLFKEGIYSGDPDDLNNLLPAQRIINHYKRSLTVKDFKEWYLGGLHERLKKLPKKTKSDSTKKRKAYLLEVADYFGISEDKPFKGLFYFEKIDPR